MLVVERPQTFLEDVARFGGQMSGCGRSPSTHTLLALLLMLGQISEIRRCRMMLVCQGSLTSLVLILLTQVPVLARTCFDMAGNRPNSRLGGVLPGNLVLVLGLRGSDVIERDLGWLLTMAGGLG